MFKNLAGAALTFDGMTHHRPLEEAIGLGMMMSSGQSSHHQSSNGYYESSEDYAARHARADYEMRERYDRERREQEAERRERDELDRRKEEAEANYAKERSDILDAHRAFIAAASRMNADELIVGITALAPLRKPVHSDFESQWPESYENLFKIILRGEFNDTIKLNALNLLFDLGYPSNNLFAPNLLPHLLSQSPAFAPIIFNCYSTYIHSFNAEPFEKMLWKKFIEHNENYPTQTAEILQKSRKADVQIEFATLWIKSLNTAKEIEAVSKFYDSMYENNKYAAYIDKIADQRLLTLQMGKPASEQAKSAKPRPIKDAEITTFLASHRSACCFSFSTPAEKIYEKIVRNKMREALDALKNEQDKMTQEYNELVLT